MIGEYHKIQSIFRRNETTHKFVDGEFSLPEFEYLKNNKWLFTEKIDGMNIRVMWQEVGGLMKLGFAGKTDAAQLPTQLETWLHKTFNEEKMHQQFPIELGLHPQVCLFGEGYGPKIQKCGGLYRNDQAFVLFDVLIGGWWLTRESVAEIATAFGIDVVPNCGSGTLMEAIEKVRAGFDSALHIGQSHRAEGLVCRPAVELKARNGRRVITKIKTKDFHVQA